ncbi:MAG: VOC family protein [Solirubrobacteraceae bacterium]|nr:VOC family protein [Solirubrobacteraceae bacterium]
MFSHVFVSVGDFDRALAFYTPLMASLGLERRFFDPARPWAGWHSAVCHPHDGQPHDPGNGQMPAFTASSREVVRQAHAAGLAHGGTCEGPPGLRPQYHANYYGAYLRDPDGNKLGIACHAAEP